MEDIFTALVTLLPHISIIVIIFYFYSRKRLQGLLWMGIAYIVLALITASSIYGLRYFQERAMSAMDIQDIYQKIGIVSFVAQLVVALGLALVLNKYPDDKQDEFTHL